MLYAILAYHAEGVVESWTKEEDAALMAELLQVNDRLVREKCLGPAARLGPTRGAVTLRGKGAGMIMDGPFAETKEQLLGQPLWQRATCAAPIRPRSMKSDRFRSFAPVHRWRAKRRAETVGWLGYWLHGVEFGAKYCASRCGRRHFGN
jgi:hypothetical protein